MKQPDRTEGAEDRSFDAMAGDFKTVYGEPSEVEVIAMAMHAGWVRAIGPNTDETCVSEALRMQGSGWEKLAAIFLRALRGKKGAAR